jgi:hypothetical protein
MADVHGEERFEFPLMRLIREKAEEKDVSILAAAREVVPEYAKPLKWRDTEYNKAQMKLYNDETEANWKDSLLRKLK